MGRRRRRYVFAVSHVLPSIYPHVHLDRLVWIRYSSPFTGPPPFTASRGRACVAPSLTSPPQDSKTPLRLAAEEKRYETVKALIDLEAYNEAKDKVRRWCGSAEVRMFAMVRAICWESYWR